jgi:hypothetical protein
MAGRHVRSLRIAILVELKTQTQHGPGMGQQLGRVLINLPVHMLT